MNAAIRHHPSLDQVVVSVAIIIMAAIGVLVVWAAFYALSGSFAAFEPVAW